MTSAFRLPYRTIVLSASKIRQNYIKAFQTITVRAMSGAEVNPQNSIPDVVHNANEVMNRIRTAAEQVGRSPEEVQLVAVSKTKPAEAIQQLYDAGYRNFGENYFQELSEKAPSLPTDIRWHFIGHLQSSKASKLVKEVPNLAVVETVDSVKLANKLNNACESSGRENLDIFVQVDTSGEVTKSGVAADFSGELQELILFIVKECPRLRLKGLMTIGAPGDMTCFDRLVHVRERTMQFLQSQLPDRVLEPLQLSMGMSGDFEEAIARGATSVRVGSTIFGARIYPKKEGSS